MLYAMLKLATFAVLRTLFRFRAVGVDNVPVEGGVIIAANHSSYLDPPAIGAGIRRPLHYLAKAELFAIPGLGSLIRRLNAHPVERGASTGVLRQALGLLRAGHAILIFPEGSRGLEGTLREAQSGVAMLAARSGAPVVPTYVRGTGRALPRGSVRLRLAPITVAYGPPLQFGCARGRSAYRQVGAEIMAAIARVQGGLDTASAASGRGDARRTHACCTDPRALPAGRIH